MKSHLRSSSGFASITVLGISLCAIVSYCAFRFISIPTIKYPVLTKKVEESTPQAQLPLLFVENKGQWHSPVSYLAQRQNFTAMLFKDGFSFEPRDEDRKNAPRISLVFEGANPHVVVRGEEQQEARYNFYLGNRSEDWYPNLPSYAVVRYHQLYPGIDVVIRENEKGSLEHDLFVAPHTDLTQVIIRSEGIERLALGDDGSLIMKTPYGELRQTRPISWQIAASGEKRPISSGFKLLAKNRYTFDVQDIDPNLPLIIDPGLEWSTYLAGQYQEDVRAVVQERSGFVIVAGATDSPDFPVMNGYDSSFHGPGCIAHEFVRGPTVCGDAFVTKLSEDGSRIVWSTFLSGNGAGSIDIATALALDQNENIIVAGTTQSTDFPTTQGALAPTDPDGIKADAFIAKLDRQGRLLYSTYFGGRNDDTATALAVDSYGSAVLAGATIGTIPTTPGALRERRDCAQTSTGMCYQDTFISRISFQSQGISDLTYSTYFRGGGGDTISGVAVTPNDDVIFAGYTNSCDLPWTPGAIRPYLAGGCPAQNYDGFLGRLRMAGTGVADLLYLTAVGGFFDDYIYALSTDQWGTPVVAGFTYSTDYPVTTGAYDDRLLPARSDAFVTVINPDLSLPWWYQLAYSTHLGGNNVVASARAVRFDPSGQFIAVAGETRSPDFPHTPDAFLSMPHTAGRQYSNDIFVAKVRPNTGGPTDLIYSTFIGSSDSELLASMTFMDGGAATIVGDTLIDTYAHDFPVTTGAFDSRAHALYDGFVTQLKLPTDISISLTPLSPEPVTVAPGGTLSYRIEVRNNTQLPWEVDLRLEGFMPDGSPVRGGAPIVGPQHYTLSPNQVVRGRVSHHIPANAPNPSGPYYIRGFIQTDYLVHDTASLNFVVR